MHATESKSAVSMKRDIISTVISFDTLSLTCPEQCSDLPKGTRERQSTLVRPASVAARYSATTDSTVDSSAAWAASRAARSGATLCRCAGGSGSCSKRKQPWPMRSLSSGGVSGHGMLS